MVKDLEVGRKLFHILAYSFVFIIGCVIYQNHGLPTTKWALFILLIVLLIGDYLTTELNIKLPLYSHFQRDLEVKRGIHSSTYGILGSLLALQFFELRIAVAVILIMVISDQAAALTGKILKSPPFFKKKTLSGASSALFMNLIIAFFILNTVPLIIGIALAATLVELFVEKIDDNLMIPVFAGLVGQLLSFI